ncbi:MAG: hypothetical protein EA376_03875 [Phycisphaeraceae bacterium]|nr:MAG: hypothetical protein EA376_03875 [Phycisphaeraceae bacterium]
MFAGFDEKGPFCNTSTVNKYSDRMEPDFHKVHIVERGGKIVGERLLRPPERASKTMYLVARIVGDRDVQLDVSAAMRKREIDSEGLCSWNLIDEKPVKNTYNDRLAG